jgi:uncharacterized membrane protein
MTLNKTLKIANMLFPIIGIELMVFYEVCETSCSYLQGTFAGVDLKYIGIFFMAALLAVSLPFASRYETPVNHLRTMMLAGALGGEILLVHFQIVHETYCPFCVAFGLCILILFTSNIGKMNKYLAAGSFVAGVSAFWLFFEGSVLPLYI